MAIIWANPLMKSARLIVLMKVVRIQYPRRSSPSWKVQVFEDAIRNAISLGGDSDTLAAITGSIAEAAYGIPEEIVSRSFRYLDSPMLEVYKRWTSFLETNYRAI